MEGQINETNENADIASTEAENMSQISEETEVDLQTDMGEAETEIQSHAVESETEAEENVQEVMAETEAEVLTEVNEDISQDQDKLPDLDETKKKKKRKKKDKFAFEKDIRYRGPLSYRHLKILGWLCIVISQISVIEGLKQKTIGTGSSFFTNSTIISQINSLALPLLLMSVFAFLLQKRDNYSSTILVYSLASIGIFALFLFVYLRYILGIVQPIANTVDLVDTSEALTDFLYDIGFNGFIPFNIFIDILLCTLIMFFIDYTPKRFFTGKKLVFFRAMVVFPMAYEFGCIMLKILATNRLIALPLWVSPLLTTKPPVSILMFFSIVRFFKIQKRKFLKTGRSEEEYLEYQKTNRHSFAFAKHLILIIFIYAVLDFILLVVLTAVHLFVMYGMSSDAMTSENILESLLKVMNWGIGGTLGMVDIIPLLLLFSYTRTHKMAIIDTIIAVVGVVAIVVVYLDGGFQIIQNSIGNIYNVLRESMGSMG